MTLRRHNVKERVFYLGVTADISSKTLDKLGKQHTGTETDKHLCLHLLDGASFSLDEKLNFCVCMFLMIEVSFVRLVKDLYAAKSFRSSFTLI